MSEGLLDDDPFGIAREKNWRIVIPEPNEAQLDYDDIGDGEMGDVVLLLKKNELDRMLDRMRGAGFDLEVTEITVSPGGNRHVYLRCKSHNLDPMARVALQAILGSDPVREMLSFLRIITQAKRPPTVFYELQKEDKPELKDDELPW